MCFCYVVGILLYNIFLQLCSGQSILSETYLHTFNIDIFYIHYHASVFGLRDIINVDLRYVSYETL